MKKAKIKMVLIAVAVAFAFGCERTDEAKPADSRHAEKAESVCTSNDVVMSETLARIAAINESLTNCLYQVSDKVMALHKQFCDEIRTLSPEDGERCAQAMVRSVLAVPYEHLDIDKRLHALDRMWDMMWGIDWPGMSVVDLWEARVLWLSKIRDVITHTQSETNNQARRYFIAYQSSRLENRTEHFERTLAFWNSLPSSSAVRFYQNGEMTDAEYNLIKVKFENFLGRPIRTCEEIRRTNSKRGNRRGSEDVQREVERQQRAAQILEDKRSGKKDSWYIGFMTNQQESTINPSTRK